jgi:flagellar motility protein MotE (MotC chaperone)
MVLGIHLWILQTISPSPAAGSAQQVVSMGDLIKEFSAFATVAAAAIGGGYGVYRAIKKVQENARKARKAEEQETENKIKDAVEKKTVEMQALVDMSQQATAHWQTMATLFEKEKNHALELWAEEKKRMEAESSRIRDERNRAIENLDAAKLKIEEVVDLNLGMQGKINENSQLIDQLRKEVEANHGKPAPNS